jgi:hypothetical protein
MLTKQECLDKMAAAGYQPKVSSGCSTGCAFSDSCRHHQRPAPYREICQLLGFPTGGWCSHILDGTAHDWIRVPPPAYPED